MHRADALTLLAPSTKRIFGSGIVKLIFIHTVNPQTAKGKVKEVAGKVTGDAKLESEGKAAGKVRNAIGGIKDTLRGK